ncbi:STAS-like domain-containing protein [Acinetobacter baumannii]|uniref:STAS-like domain-containing protein n=1 Tax=Acinetobacter baumannii TaxID=470 RepID=UPI00123B8796|nr:STAS-like domain-containing protein [Acinetobacter baumannii]MDC4548631.1 STAS-like domain-containing protein [Acinetobacter baumannii]MDC4951991.1 STAS-like domain-containing protein [Acinetobacter baumannii]MDC5352424.1 STAS-like domain-containing protein [Acinetobacter baumannii]MDK2187061.1 STAS-like domain-containing protein [Acinetobacter baumannii]MDK2259870.1 STAS-like domain-containing protein [Acinetobacter baumannii]
MNTIKVYELTGRNAISMQKGDKVYQILIQNIRNNQNTILDFQDVSLFASPFFNAAIGHLLKDITIDELLAYIRPVNLNDTGKELLNLVISNALSFYSERENNSE